MHSDICGPMQTPSNNGARYLISFIDDFSRETFVFFLKNKFDALQTVKNFKISAERKIGKTFKTLRCDNGGEYTSKAFKDYYCSNGIKM